MKASNKRQRFIEYLNYITHIKHVDLHPFSGVIEAFTSTTNIMIPKSTAYRIISNYIKQQEQTLHSQVNDEILKIYND